MCNHFDSNIDKVDAASEVYSKKLDVVVASNGSDFILTRLVHGAAIALKLGCKYIDTVHRSNVDRKAKEGRGITTDDLTFSNSNSNSN